MVAVVDGERLGQGVSGAQARWRSPRSAVATDSRRGLDGTRRATVAGQVVLGSQSRIILEPGDEKVTRYYLLDIIQRACRSIQQRRHGFSSITREQRDGGSSGIVADGMTTAPSFTDGPFARTNAGPGGLRNPSRKRLVECDPAVPRCFQNNSRSS